MGPQTPDEALRMAQEELKEERAARRAATSAEADKRGIQPTSREQLLRDAQARRAAIEEVHRRVQGMKEGEDRPAVGA